MPAKSKLNSIETLILDCEINHEESKTTVNEKGKHGKMKEDIRMTKSSVELNKEKGKITEIQVKILGIHKINFFSYMYKIKHG